MVSGWFLGGFQVVSGWLPDGFPGWALSRRLPDGFWLPTHGPKPLCVCVFYVCMYVVGVHNNVYVCACIIHLSGIYHHVCILPYSYLVQHVCIHRINLQVNLHFYTVWLQ